MIDYRFWRLDTPLATSAKDVAAALEKARDEYMTTNTPAVRGVNGLWCVDEPLRDAIVRQMTAGIAAAKAIASALGDGAHVSASISGHVVAGSENGVDERMTVSVDKVPSPRASLREQAGPRLTMVGT